MEPFIGMISSFAFSFAPQNWVFCAGQVVAISQQQTLFSLLGNFYGGDGRTTFAYPDLRGRSPMGVGRHPGSLYDWRIGQQAGVESHTHSVAEMPVHSHSAVFTPDGSGGTPAAGKLKAWTSNADNATPSAGAFLSGGGGTNSMYGPGGGFGNTEVELGGLEITGGGGGGGGSVTVDNNGGGEAFNILGPRLVINYCMAEIGIYPSRN